MRRPQPPPRRERTISASSTPPRLPQSHRAGTRLAAPGTKRTPRGSAWELEEQLLGSGFRSEREGLLQGLAERLAEERIVLSQIEAELREQTRRVSELEEQLSSSSGFGSSPATSTLESHPPPKVLILRSMSPPDRDYWLSRCEGFLVESPTGRCVGVVAGLRFDLRIDRPDLLEVE